MPQYTVPIPGGGAYHVNANSESDAYANVGLPYSGGGGGGSSGGGGGGGGGGDQGFNGEAARLAAQLADNAAQQAYLNAKLKLDTETAAEAKAQAAWQRTFSEQTQQNTVMTGLLGLGSQLTGPANYLRYLKTLSGTPQGLRDLVNAAAGRIDLSRFGAAQPGATYEPQSVNTLIRDLSTGGAAGLAEMAAQAGSVGGGDSGAAALPSGSQWDARNLGLIRQSPTQSGLLRGLYESGGRSFDEELANFYRSLPRFGGAAAGKYALPMAA